jgi:hypothetical protein
MTQIGVCQGCWKQAFLTTVRAQVGETLWLCGACFAEWREGADGDEPPQSTATERSLALTTVPNAQE